MKKFLVFVCLIALVSFAGLAFAGERGAINPSAVIKKADPVVVYHPIKSDIEIEYDETSPWWGVASIKSVSADVVTPLDFDANTIHQPTQTSNEIAVMTNVGVNAVFYKISTDPRKITFLFKKYPDTRKDEVYAFIKAKTDAANFDPGKYHGFLCTVKDEILSFTVDYPEQFFSDDVEDTVVIATAKTVDTSGGGGGGGCNAGYAGLLLFAAVPFFFRKKK